MAKKQEKKRIKKSSYFYLFILNKIKNRYNINNMSAETTSLVKSNETFGLNNLKLDTSSSSSSADEKIDIEHFYDLCRRAESADEPNKYLTDRVDANNFDVNNLLN